jgi:hypothetical protein
MKLSPNPPLCQYTLRVSRFGKLHVIRFKEVAGGNVRGITDYFSGNGPNIPAGSC